MRVLFITRKYPPQVGGMEQFSHGLINNFHEDKKTIILNKSQKNLWWWLPYATLSGIIKAFSVDVVHLGDVVLAPAGYLIKLITRKPVVVTAHGLDVVYQHKIFKKINLPCLRKLDKIICISATTRQECLKRGVAEDKTVIIPNGIDPDKFQNPCLAGRQAKSKIQKNFKFQMITVGRLVQRKGVNWFIRKVMPHFSDLEYLVIGRGPEEEKIKQSIKELKLENRVRFLGKISDEELKEYYNQADLFVMPNIKVEEDREGFGIVLLEAASVGLPIVASNLEGIKDAIQPGKNGWLVEWGNAKSFIDKIQELLNTPDLPTLREQIKQYTIEHYSWSQISQLYLAEFRKII